MTRCYALHCSDHRACSLRDQTHDLLYCDDLASAHGVDGTAFVPIWWKVRTVEMPMQVLVVDGRQKAPYGRREPFQFPVWTKSTKSDEEENLEIRRRLGKHALRVLYISQQTSWQNSATKERNHIILRIWCSCHVYCSLGILKICLQYNEDLKRYICNMLTNSSQCVCSSKLFN